MKSTIIAFIAAITAVHADSSTLGKIGDLEIKTEEIREALAGLEAGQDTELAKDPAALGQYVRALLIQRLVLQEALAKKWDQEPEVVAKLVRARESALTESYLESVSKVPADFPAQADLEAAYQAAKASLLVPKSYHLAQVFVAAPKDADKATADKAKAKIDAVAKKLKEKSSDFSAIAKAESEEAASKDRGGEIGWLAEAQIQPEIRDRLPKLAAGAITEPVKLDDGWHILKVLEAKEARTPTLDEVKDQLAIQLRAERARLNRQEYLARLLKTNPLAINEIELAKIIGSTKP
ncbi:peptidylprolyl isomerase [Luteolibacter sp. GHJ8]|uniref:Peptidylprolyl isomerase n=1 Tax=Luteolibacter rhizosphaerae TaxID=2989719 RepID=A0ABT3FWK1_9BACT|nr:peptidylprolyl isomerase [Luteolibacter rhizosphaerae]MCW1911937.1 peptidylprolyl isomerase [Luteolibacter rhizosphaerae]